MFPLMDGQTIIWYTYVLQAESRQLRMFGSSLNYACWATTYMCIWMWSLTVSASNVCLNILNVRLP